MSLTIDTQKAQEFLARYQDSYRSTAVDMVAINNKLIDLKIKVNLIDS